MHLVYEFFLWNCISECIGWLVNIDWGNGLVQSDNESLAEPMMTKICAAIWRHKTIMWYLRKCWIFFINWTFGNKLTPGIKYNIFHSRICITKFRRHNSSILSRHNALHMTVKYVKHLSVSMRIILASPRIDIIEYSDHVTNYTMYLKLGNMVIYDHKLGSTDVINVPWF